MNQSLGHFCWSNLGVTAVDRNPVLYEWGLLDIGAHRFAETGSDAQRSKRDSSETNWPPPYKSLAPNCLRKWNRLGTRDPESPFGHIIAKDSLLRDLSHIKGGSY